MKVSIPCLYAEYGRYTDELRMIPYYLDCLKPVERRVLFALHELPKNKFVKCARVVGDCIGKYHPHGDSSTYGSLVSLVHRQYVVPQGNFGSINLKQTRPAAYRYTESKLEPFVENFVFELIKYVDWGDPENLNEPQPLYLTSPVPLGLIGEGLISGISFNTTKIPRFTLPDLIKRLEYLFQKEYNPNMVPHTIIPNFPNFHIVENEVGDFENILTQGKGSIKLIPKVMVDHRGVRVYGKPPGGVTSWVKENDLYDIIDLSSGTFEILFSPKSGPVTQPFVDNIMELVTSKVHFICNVINSSGTVELKSIDDLLLSSYNKWHNNLKSKFEDQRDGLIGKLFELKVIAIIREIINNHNVNIHKVDNIVSIFNTTFKTKYPDVSEEHIRQACSKHSIRVLIEHQLDAQSVQIKLNEVNNTISNITTVAYQKMKDYIK